MLDAKIRDDENPIKEFNSKEANSVFNALRIVSDALLNRYTKLYFSFNMDTNSIKFPICENEEKNIWSRKTLDLSDFVKACFKPGKHLEQTLNELNDQIYLTYDDRISGGERLYMETEKSQEIFFINFLKVIYQFIHLGLLKLILRRFLFVN